MCNNIYCQKCLQKCVEDEVEHDHDRTCCSKFCGLVDIMIDWGKDADATPCEYLKAALIFVLEIMFYIPLSIMIFLKKIKLLKMIVFIHFLCI